MTRFRHLPALLILGLALLFGAGAVQPAAGQTMPAAAPAQTDPAEPLFIVQIIYVYEFNPDTGQLELVGEIFIVIITTPPPV